MAKEEEKSICYLLNYSIVLPSGKEQERLRRIEEDKWAKEEAERLTEEEVHYCSQS